MQILQRFKNWRSSQSGQSPVASVPYHIECQCGKVNSGQRQVNHQVVSCAECGRRLFVLPISPLPPVESVSRIDDKSHLQSRSYKLWLMPVAAGALTLAVLVAVIVYSRFGGNTSQKNGSTKKQIDHAKVAKEAEESLRQGQYRLAANRFDAVLPKLSPAKRTRWIRQAKQASLLADLLSEPLETVAQHAIDVRTDEWEAEFPHRYRDKGVVFDLPLQRTETGAYSHSYEWPVAAGEIRIAFETIALLKRLPLDEPRRVIFGARLASIRLEEPGPMWVIRFQPDSGVLITEFDAIIRCCPALNDEESKRVLEEQKEFWR